MICLPYYINGTYQVARFGDRQTFVPSFIIEKPTETTLVNLFRFDPKKRAFQLGSGTGENFCNDYIVNGIDATAESQNDVINLNIRLKYCQYSEGADGAFKMNSPGFSLINNCLFFDYSAIDEEDFDVKTLKVKFLWGDNDQFSYSLKIHVANRTKIWDLVVDFGSEASQIWKAPRDGINNQNLNNRIPLFGNVLEFYHKNEHEKLIRREIVMNDSPQNDNSEKPDPNGYYQYDAGDNSLYKSLFFLSSSLEGNNITENDLIFLNKSEELIAILQEGFIALPNLKLMHHGEVSLPIIHIRGEQGNGADDNLFQYIDKLRDIILSLFIRTAFRQISATANNDEVNDKVVCKLIFLVPNTYSQRELSEVRKSISKISEELLNEESCSKIIGVEVELFSESDASFLGYFRGKRKIDSDKRYLLIDVGKGTTDFSVLKIKDGNRAVCEARSGVVGAGNVMTFAVLAAVLHAMAVASNRKETSETIRQFLIDICNSDRAKKNELYSLLEELKCTTGPTQEIDGEKLDFFISGYVENFQDFSLDIVSLDGLIEMLRRACENKCYIPKDNKVMKGYAELIAGMIVDELKFVYHEHMIGIDYLIFAGRGIKSEVLKDALCNALRKSNPRIILMDMEDPELKMACLRGPLNNMVTLENTNIVGWPILRKEGETTSKSKSNNRSFLQNLLERNEELGNETNMQSKESYMQESPLELNPMEYFFSVGNRKCKIKSDNNDVRPGTYYTCFDGDDFLLRSKDSVYRLTPAPTAESYSLVYETLFPMLDSQKDNFQNNAFRSLENILPKIEDPKEAKEKLQKSAVQKDGEKKRRFIMPK